MRPWRWSQLAVFALSCRSDQVQSRPTVTSATSYITYSKARWDAHTSTRYGDADCGPASVVTVLRLLGKLPVGEPRQSQVTEVRHVMDSPFGRSVGPDQLQHALDAYGVRNAVIAAISLEDIAYALDCGFPVIMGVHGTRGGVPGHAFPLTGHRITDEGTERWFLSDPAFRHPQETSTTSWFPGPRTRFLGIVAKGTDSDPCTTALCRRGAVGSLCAIRDQDPSK